MKKQLGYWCLAMILGACKQTGSNEAMLDKFARDQLQDWNRQLSKVIMKDIFTPPVCGRIYAYANLAAYSALQPGHSANFRSLAGQLRGLDSLPTPPAGEHYFPVASIIAFATVSKKLIHDKVLIEDFEDHYLAKVKEMHVPPQVLARSIAYGQQIGDRILDWAAQDNYRESRTYPRFVLSRQPGKWQPTPPDYMAAIEPYWNTMRQFVLDSAAQFKPDRPLPFDTAHHSLFYLECKAIYQQANQLTSDQAEIARFWDCNPNTSFTKGHLTIFRQKLSPGGHWISIVAQATKAQNTSLIETSAAFMLTSIAIADGFISCWDEKYRSALIRPQTYINRYIDPNWEPLLQTPAFPEYPSGHSVVSGAASTVLAELFGSSFAFADSTQLAFGLPIRHFSSFDQAAQEAATSRFYGGIHYRQAVQNGLVQGREVGKYVLDKVKIRNYPNK